MNGGDLFGLAAIASFVTAAGGACAVGWAIGDLSFGAGGVERRAWRIIGASAPVAVVAFIAFVVFLCQWAFWPQ